MELREKSNFLASLFQTPVERPLPSPHHVAEGDQEKKRKKKKALGEIH